MNNTAKLFQYMVGYMREDSSHSILWMGEVAAHSIEEAQELLQRHYYDATYIDVDECPNPFEYEECGPQ